jgi:hypothetical protein
MEKFHKENEVRRVKSAHTIPKYDANGLSPGFHIIGTEYLRTIANEKLESWAVTVRNTAVKAYISECPTYDELHTKCTILTAL